MYIIAVNDAFVTKAWGETFPSALEQGFRFLSDAGGELTEALKMGYDSAGVWGTRRSKRYVVYVEEGVVKKVWEEGDNTGVKGEYGVFCVRMGLIIGGRYDGREGAGGDLEYHRNYKYVLACRCG